MADQVASDDGSYLDVALHARSTILLAAATCGKPAIDAVYLDSADEVGLAAEAHDAVLAGFIAKASIHPRQSTPIRDAFRPTSAELIWARRVVEATVEGGVHAVDGVMVDGPLRRQAMALVAASQVRGGRPASSVSGRSLVRSGRGGIILQSSQVEAIRMCDLVGRVVQ